MARHHHGGTELRLVEVLAAARAPERLNRSDADGGADHENHDTDHELVAERRRPPRPQGARRQSPFQFDRNRQSTRVMRSAVRPSQSSGRTGSPAGAIARRNPARMASVPVPTTWL